MFIIFYNPIVGSIFLFLKEEYLNISTLKKEKEIIPLEFRSIKIQNQNGKYSNTRRNSTLAKTRNREKK